jgi:ureidoacrylate peracid hydrolase
VWRVIVAITDRRISVAASAGQDRSVTATALLMIDMQNTYLPGDEMRDALGWPPIWRLDETVTACAELLAAARAGGVQVIYSKDAGRVARTPGNARFARFLELRAGRLPQVTTERAAWKRSIMDAVAPQPGDVLVEKRWPSFFDDTELETLLRARDVRRLIVAGLQTNVCVEATARAALIRGFEVAVPEDAVSTDGPDLHRAGLNSMRVLYVEVAPWRELLAPDAPWDRALTTPDYGRDPIYWSEPTA